MDFRELDIQADPNSWVLLTEVGPGVTFMLMNGDIDSVRADDPFQGEKGGSFLSLFALDARGTFPSGSLVISSDIGFPYA